MKNSLKRYFKMKKIIVTTTINPPTNALKKFNKIKGWELLVVGDMKTPHEMYKDFDYFSPSEQRKKYPELSAAIGWNCIQRRNLGFIEAYNRGADIIATVDDDNIPLDNWGKDIYLNKKTKVLHWETDDLCFDPFSATDKAYCWHRGFPIQDVNSRDVKRPTFKHVTPTAQANFWNGNPDVDAICRMIYYTEFTFPKEAFPFVSNQISPFNSQNTFISRETLKDYFVFPFIGRMDDIWGAYYYLSCGHNVVYGEPTVYQHRNFHDNTIDFIDELLGYKETKRLLLNLREGAESIEMFLPSKSWRAFQIYRGLFK